MAEEKEKDKSKEKSGIIERYWVIILILLFAAGWFYWFQLRPIQVKKHCVKYSHECAASYRDTLAKQSSGFEKSHAEYQQKVGTIDTKVKERCYNECLRKYGLK